MELLTNYGSDEEDRDEGTRVFLESPTVPCTALMTAPMILRGSTSSSAASMMLVQGHNKNNLTMNPGVDVVLAPMQGPAHPFKQRNYGGGGSSRAGVGITETACVEDWAFDKEFQSFQRNGFAMDMGNNTILGDSSEYSNASDQFLRPKSEGRRSKRPRLNVPVDLGDDESPWAPEPVDEEGSHLEEDSEQEVITKSEATVDQDSSEEVPSIHAQQANVFIDEPDEEAEKWEKVTERKIGYTLPPRQKRGTGISEAESTFHGKELYDYQGRSWIAAPSGVRAETDEHDCFIPKKCIKKYTGHTKGVHAIEFFPGTGHLLLSASMDGKCKIWDVYEDRNVRRTYHGHSEAVRAINMSDNGEQFLSSAFDRVVRLWDVETGQAKASFTNRKMGYDVKFRPTDNNIFLMAASDNKIYQWDVRSGEVCQEYNYHLQPCNTVTFFDRGRKFASTSDDKKILIWEYDIPVPIKYIAEPEMHSVPSVTLSPSGDYFAGQSMDNTIVVYACGDKVKQLKKKTFTGHNNSGYACKVGFSPNGKFLVSGDGLGKLHVWDWKTTKVIDFNIGINGQK